MITRFYVNNYKTLVNFEWKPNAINLLLGPNGGGKTSVFDALRAVRDYLQGKDLNEAFPDSTLTAWMKTDIQHFELELQFGNLNYFYCLKIRNDKENHSKRERIVEELSCNNEYFFKGYINGIDKFEGQVFNYEKTITFPSSLFALTQMSLVNVFMVGLGLEVNRVDIFKELVNRLIIVNPTPALMNEISNNDVKNMGEHFENFASWMYKFFGKQHIFRYFLNEIENIIPNLISLEFEQLGLETRLLKAYFKWNNKKFSLKFSQFSDGQKMLIALYALLHSVQEPLELKNWPEEIQDEERNFCGYLFIDEPGNYLNVAEIQPFLQAASDLAYEGKVQIAFISHNPETIDYLAEDAFWLERIDGLHSTIKPLIEVIKKSMDVEKREDLSLKVSELMASRWIGEN